MRDPKLPLLLGFIAGYVVGVEIRHRVVVTKFEVENQRLREEATD